MSLLTRTPRLFSSMPTLFSDFFDDDRWPTFSGGEWASKMPAANIQEMDKEFQIELAAPGMKRDDFNVDVENGMLTISSEKEDKVDEEKEGYSRKEFSYSSFSRSFFLPENIDENNIKATYKEGILSLSLPKTNEPESTKKEIKIS